MKGFSRAQVGLRRDRVLKKVPVRPSACQCSFDSLAILLLGLVDGASGVVGALLTGDDLFHSEKKISWLKSARKLSAEVGLYAMFTCAMRERGGGGSLHD